MELVFRHFWIAFVVVTFVNGQGWWNRVQSRIRAQPDLEPGYRRLYRGYLFWTNLPWLVMGFGILSGQVPSMFDFLNPSGGNTFVVAWWGLLAALLCLGTYWIFFGGGAEMLERHPGVYMVPQWSASKLRLFWLGVVAWNIAIGAWLFLGFPGASSEPSSASLDDSWLWALFPVVFVGMWLLICFLLSAMGGWQRLAEHYVASARFSGERFYFCSAQIGYVNYGGCLTLGASPDGLYLAVFPLFRVAHPPLVIPWSDVIARESRRWFFAAVALEFAKANGISVRISRRLAQVLFDASGTQVPVQPSV
ncbi:MAG: hypothetical protein ACRD2Z_05545 [Thermoanaerobaculia bacterium]